MGHHPGPAGLGASIAAGYQTSHIRPQLPPAPAPPPPPQGIGSNQYPYHSNTMYGMADQQIQSQMSLNDSSMQAWGQHHMYQSMHRYRHPQQSPYRQQHAAYGQQMTHNQYNQQNLMSMMQQHQNINPAAYSLSQQRHASHYGQNSSMLYPSAAPNSLQG